MSKRSGGLFKTVLEFAAVGALVWLIWKFWTGYVAASSGAGAAGGLSTPRVASWYPQGSSNYGNQVSPTQPAGSSTTPTGSGADTSGVSFLGGIPSGGSYSIGPVWAQPGGSVNTGIPRPVAPWRRGIFLPA